MWFNLKTIPGRVFLALLTALLLWAAWPAGGCAPLLFIALIPLLLLEESIASSKKEGQKINLFWYAYLSFFTFNLITTFWIWYASPFGMFGAVMANALLMTIIFQLFHITKRRLGVNWGYASLIVYWMAGEMLHMDWDLSWPWLNLGNGFAAWANMVQWYEYTGTLGGTLWVWLVNILLFSVVTGTSLQKRKQLICVLGLIIIPVIISWTIRWNYKEEVRPVEVVAVQPNVDPYNEKFSGNSDEQLNRMLRLASTLVTPKTRLVIFPETALPDGIWEEHMEQHRQIKRIREFLGLHPGLRLLTGLTSFKMYQQGEKVSLTARQYGETTDSFDAYNTGMQIGADGKVQLHHKSKLVPGVEKMPFPALFSYIGDFAIDLGGTAGSLGVQDHPSVFTGDSISAAPVICYESIYGDYLAQYVREGANIICIMTNDGWWSDTPGYRQHCQYARLRAIETRRSIARSANTGISCFVDQKGDLFQKTGWWVPAVIRQELNLNNRITFYARFGDYLGRIALGISVLLAGATIIQRFRKSFR
ncbi:apolipoprotein N-acyltransferase [soil metagenome]